jgi:ATP-dependent DNA helicase PIF1
MLDKKLIIPFTQMISPTMNTAQQAAFDAIEAGKSIFLTGPGGTGKSYLLNELSKRSTREVSLTAMTGCAALLLNSKAKTLHSWAGVGLGTDVVPILVSKVRKSRRAALRWLKTDVLVIDEVSMMTPDLFEKLDQVGRKVRRNELLPFGGLQIVLVGDFFQLPPVSAETKFIFESPLWVTLKLEKHELTEIVRQKDPAFQVILNEARYGELSKASLRELRKRLNLDYKSLTIQPTMLFTRRVEVDQINARELKKLTTERHVYKATTIFNPSANTIGLTINSPEVEMAVQKLDGHAAYTPELILAVGAQVMLLTNLNSEAGLVNGSRGVIVDFKKAEVKGDDPEGCKRSVADLLKAPKVLVQRDETLMPLVEFKSGERRLIDYHSWEVQDFPGILRKQIPLKLAYAVTIHKAQGATLDCALIDVGDRTFEYGQAYVALSRCKDMDSLYIHDIRAEAFRANPKVKEFYRGVQN